MESIGVKYQRVICTHKYSNSPFFFVLPLSLCFVFLCKYLYRMEKKKIIFDLEERNYICPISSGGGTHQDVCRPTRPQTLSSRPILLSGRSYLGGIPRLKRSNSSREHTKQRYELGKWKWKRDVSNSSKSEAFSTSI